MILPACFCLILLNCVLTTAYDSVDKANEINYYIVVNYLSRHEVDFPKLETSLEQATVICETQINNTIDTCLACIARNQNSGRSAGNVGFDQVILGLIPAPVIGGFSNFGDDIKKTFAKDIPNFFTKDIPKIGGDIGTFFTKSLPGVGKTVGKELGTFFSKTLPNVGKTVGKEIGGFFKNTIGGGLKDLFGRRRRRAASVCPSCDLIDTETKNADQIRRGVCGDEVYNIFEEYTNTANIFEWLRAENAIVTKVSFNKDHSINDPFAGVFTVKPFTVTYSIGAGDTPTVYENTTTTLDLRDYTNEVFGNFLANKIWNQYVFEV